MHGPEAPGRRQWLTQTAALLAAVAPGAAEAADGSAQASLASAASQGAQPSARPPRVLRWAFSTPETGFDPAQVSDVNSSYICQSIFEAPLAYDHLARPARLVPQTAAELPEVSADFRQLTFRLRPGIFFADDPAFQGRPRELVAQDYVYTLKRYYDPRLNAENIYVFENARLLGLSELRAQARQAKRPFDYDREVEGIRALDRYTFRVRLGAPAPRFVDHFANATLMGAVAREVVEAHGGDITAHPVGTGPFKLAEWRRASQIVLVRNPGFRELRYASQPPAGDAVAQALARQLAGRRLPLVDRIEINVIEEAQPRWLAFLNGDLDVLELPPEFAPVAVPNGRLAPHLAKRGVGWRRHLQPDMTMSYFNMEDAVVGGYTPAKVALRLAVALAYSNEEDLRLIRSGQGIAAQSVVVPQTSGYDPAFVSEMSEHSHAKARALLDLHGYIDRNGDGWRETPEGQPLVLRLASLADQRSRRINELWRKHTAVVGLKMVFEVASWPELLKKARAGSVMMWGFSWSAQTPDGGFFLGIAYGPNASESNDSRFALPAFDHLFEQQAVLPDGPEREALIRQAKKLLTAYMPYKVHLHRLLNDLTQPRVAGYWRHPFARDVWRYVAVDGPEPAV